MLPLCNSPGQRNQGYCIRPMNENPSFRRKPEPLPLTPLDSGFRRNDRQDAGMTDSPDSKCDCPKQRNDGSLSSAAAVPLLGYVGIGLYWQPVPRENPAAVAASAGLLV